MKVTTTSGTKFGVSTVEAVHRGFGKHGVVLDLRLAQRRAVVGDEHQLRVPGAQRLERLLRAQLILAGLHHELQARVDVVLVRLLLILISKLEQKNLLVVPRATLLVNGR